MQYNKLMMIFLCALDKNVLWVYVFLWVHFLSDTFRTPIPDVTKWLQLVPEHKTVSPWETTVSENNKKQRGK